MILRGELKNLANLQNKTAPQKNLIPETVENTPHATAYTTIVRSLFYLKSKNSCDNPNKTLFLL